jgi:hypothetical protein
MKSIILKNEDTKPIRAKLYIATPTLGIIRVEWAAARYSAVIPCNWSVSGSNYGMVHTYPMGYLIAEAQNLAVSDAIATGAEWLLLLEDDTMPPPDIFLRLNEYMKKATIPVVSGLYFLKGNYPEPLVYRGRGNSAYSDFKLGDLVWADGVPTGCLMIHMSILKLMYDESPEVGTSLGRSCHKVFETPSKVWYDAENGVHKTACGTSDLYWCDRVMKDKVLERSGWKKFAKAHPKYPFLVDTNIACEHIDLNTGKRYPIGGFKKGKK